MLSEVQAEPEGLGISDVDWVAPSFDSLGSERGNLLGQMFWSPAQQGEPETFAPEPSGERLAQ
jgi:hypothetical protein